MGDGRRHIARSARQRLEIGRSRGRSHGCDRASFSFIGPLDHLDLILGIRRQMTEGDLPAAGFGSVIKLPLGPFRGTAGQADVPIAGVGLTIPGDGHRVVRRRDGHVLRGDELGVGQQIAPTQRGGDRLLKWMAHRRHLHLGDAATGTLPVMRGVARTAGLAHDVTPCACAVCAPAHQERVRRWCGVSLECLWWELGARSLNLLPPCLDPTDLRQEEQIAWFRQWRRQLDQRRCSRSIRNRRRVSHGRAERLGLIR